MQRYFIKGQIENNKKVCIEQDDIHHIKKVMRGNNGDSIVCIDESGTNYHCIIENIENEVIIAREIIENDTELDVDVTLVYALPKGDKFDLVLQKATELGVKRIVPLLTSRSIIKTNKERFSKKLQRYHKIVKEASEQSYRNKIPEITNVIILSELVKYLGNHAVVAYEEEAKVGKHKTFATLLKQINKGDKVTIIVGCEGGFSSEEITYMQSLGIQSCSLGKRILRSETAPLYMLSVIGYMREIGE